MSEPAFLTEAELAARWRWSRETLRQQRSRGMSVIPYTTVNKSVRYRLGDIINAERIHPK